MQDNLERLAKRPAEAVHLSANAEKKSGRLPRRKLPRFPQVLTKRQIRQYREEGYLVFRKFISRAMAKKAKRAITEVTLRQIQNPEIAEYVPMDESGDHMSGARWNNRSSNFYIQLEAGWDPAGKTDLEIEAQVRKLMNYHNEHPIFRQIGIDNVNLLRVLGQLFKDHAILYQSVAFIKPAKIGTAKAWHQDNAYFRMKNLDKVLGIWIALENARVENGCMHVLPGGHKLGPLRHHHTKECEIMPDRFNASLGVPVELDPGDIMIFHSNLPHMTPANKSNRRRRALQFHYRAANNRILTFEEYEKIFAEKDGTPASCAAAQARGL